MGVGDLLFGKIVWPLWARRDHPHLMRFVAEIERRQFDPPVIRANRFSKQLQSVVRHAAATVPYYRSLFAQLRLSPESIRSVDDLRRLPVLTKQHIREHGPELVSEVYRRRTTITKKTSGSTGVPLRIRLDLDGLAWKRAATLVADEWSGWRRGRRVAKVWGNPEHHQFGWKGWLRNKLFDRAIHLDTLKMSESEIAAFARRLARFRPSLIFGHAHSVALLAATIRDRNLPRCRPDGIITTAMVLHGYQRKLIEEVFDCPVTNRYGCEEVSLIACECPAHRGLHVNDQAVYVELLNGGQLVATGQPGKVVVTDLSNFAMPLLRYEVGDVATWSTEPCPCGRGAAMLKSIEGREADYVRTSSGHYVSGISLTENFATLVPGIAQLQIVQEAVDRFLFRIVRGQNFDPTSESRIGELVRERFGADTQFRCEFVASIPQEPSGKYRFCISHVTGAVSAGRAA